MRFLIRAADFNDREDLLELAHCFPLCSLPQSKIKLEKKIQTSQESFAQSLPKEKRNYLFVLEDRKEKKVIGSSQILSYFGKDKSLCYLLLKEKNSLKLARPKKGKNHIGGLILHPKYRKSKKKLGVQISMARFLYIKNFPTEFSPLVDVSLTAPIEKGRNAFWEETGKKILRKNYSSALKIFQKDRAHFLSLFPKNLKISLDSLSSQAKNYLTEIHPQSQSVYKGLLKIGFYKTKCHHIVDGGIYLEASWSKLNFLKKTKKLILTKALSVKKTNSYLMTQQTEKGFICTQVEGKQEKEKLLVKTNLRKFKAGEKILTLKFPV